MDSLQGTRKQHMVIYVKILDQVNQEKKYSMTGQMSLFDIVSDDQKSEFDIPLPNVGEYEKETLLAFEKEVLGIYVSGHPMEEYEGKWRKNITNTTLDFQIDEETGRTKVREGSKAIIGGMITGKTIKNTKTNKTMAFLNVEDLVGTVEVVVFPRDYEKSRMYLNEDTKVFVKGRVSEEDDNASKLICESIIPFEQVPCELWIQFPDIASYQSEEKKLLEMTKMYEGNDTVAIYCTKEKAMKKWPANRKIQANAELLDRLYMCYGKDRVKKVEKKMED